MVRAKFFVESITEYANTSNVQVRLRPVVGQGNDENTVFGKLTPNGQIEMVVANPVVAARFRAGRECYVTFSLEAETEPDYTPPSIKLEP